MDLTNIYFHIYLNTWIFSYISDNIRSNAGLVMEPPNYFSQLIFIYCPVKQPYELFIFSLAEVYAYGILSYINPFQVNTLGIEFYDS